MPIIMSSLIGGAKDIIMKPSGTFLMNPFITAILIVGFILVLLFIFSESDNLMLKVGVWGGIFTTIVLFYHNKAIKSEIESKNNYNNETIEGDNLDLATITPTVSGGSRNNNGSAPTLPKLRSLLT